MAEFPNDSELHHVSGVEVPDDANHYAVKDEYARNLADILNYWKSEVYIGKPGISPSAHTHIMNCHLDSKVFKYDKNVLPGDVGLIGLASVFIDVVLPVDGSSVAKTYTVDISNTDWENLDYNNMNTRITPIRVSFNLGNKNTSDDKSDFIASDIILAYSYMFGPSFTGSVYLFSGTGVIYTGNTIDDYIYALVRMKLQETDGKKQAVITVTELPKDSSGGSVNAVATELADGTANLSFS